MQRVRSPLKVVQCRLLRRSGTQNTLFVLTVSVLLPENDSTKIRVSILVVNDSAKIRVSPFMGNDSTKIRVSSFAGERFYENQG